MHFNHPDRTLLPPSTRCRNLSITYELIGKDS